MVKEFPDCGLGGRDCCCGFISWGGLRGTSAAVTGRENRVSDPLSGVLGGRSDPTLIEWFCGGDLGRCILLWLVPREADGCALCGRLVGRP